MTKPAPPRRRFETAEIVWDDHRRSPSVVLHRRGPDAQIVLVGTMAEAEGLLLEQGFEPEAGPAGTRDGERWIRRAPDDSEASCIEERSRTAQPDVPPG